MQDSKLSFFKVMGMVLFGALFATSVSINDNWKNIDSFFANQRDALTPITDILPE